MSIGVFLAVMGAALLHAGWNALIKLGTSRLGGMVLFSAVSVPIGLAVAALRPLPPAEAWPWLAGSAVIHVAYKLFLTFALDRGDLSRVYPIARGAAPLIVLVIGALLLPDRMSSAQTLGVIVMGAGLVAMAGGVFTDGEARGLLPFALGSACATAAYSLVDGMGARVAGDAIAYVAWVFVLDGALFAGTVAAARGRAVLAAGAREWALAALAATASYGAYAITVWAMTLAPIALVAALRESSILFAVLIGWLAFGERLRPTKAMAAVLIVAGVVVTRL